MSWASMLEQTRNVLTTKLFVIGDTAVTVSTVIALLLILLATKIVARVLKRAVRRGLSRRVGHEGTVDAINKLLHYVVLVIGWSIGLQTIGVNLTALFAAGAVFAVGLGFAMKNIAENFVSGVILLAERSVRPGDIIHVEGRVVRIEQIGIRATLVQTRDCEDLILPNSILVQSAVNNYTLRDSVYRTRITVGVTYASDMARVAETLAAAARDAAGSIKGVIATREPDVIMVDFADSSVNFEVAMWVDDPWGVRAIRSAVMQKIWWALKEEGIEIAFPQLDVHFDAPVTKGFEALATRAA